jgi:ankyrin repeat protein
MEGQPETSESAQRPISSDEQHAPRQPRKAWVLGLAVLVMVLLAGGLAIWAYAGTAGSREERRAAELLLAIKKGHTARARTILERRPEFIHAELRCGFPALCWAVKSGHLEMVQLLVEMGAEPNARFDFGKTPLQVCAWNRGRYDIARFLIERGADARAVDNEGTTILWLAVEQAGWDGSRLPFIKLLLENGADPNRAVSRTSDGVGAAASGSASLPGDGTLELIYPLQQAVLSNVPELVEVLLVGGADPNMMIADGSCSMLHLAVILDRHRVIKTLISHGAALDAKDSQGKTPLELAVEQKRDHIADILRAYLEEAEEAAKGDAQKPAS